MQKLLVTIDNIETTTPASPLVERVVELARAFSSKVWLVHIVPPVRPAPFNVPGKLLRHEVSAELCHEHKLLQQLAHSLREEGIDATALLIEGATVRTILEESDRLDVDLIIVGSHGHGLWYRALLDGTRERLVSRSTRPVMFVPEPLT